MKRAILKLVALAFFLGSVGQAKAGNIDITGNWSGFSYVYDFGSPSFATATYGQTITAPVSGSDDLTGFTFYISDYSGR